MAGKVQAHPKLVNHRWQLPSLEEIIDRALPAWAEGEHPDFSQPDGHARLRTAFLTFGRDLLSRLEFELTKAAGKGIAQALELIQDPEYYETVKMRRARDRERLKEWRNRDEKQSKARQEELARRERCELTEIERLHEMAHVAIQIHYHEKELRKLNERREKLDRCIPIKEKPQIADVPVDDNGDDFWPDRISFD